MPTQTLLAHTLLYNSTNFNHNIDHLMKENTIVFMFCVVQQSTAKWSIFSWGCENATRKLHSSL